MRLKWLKRLSPNLQVLILLIFILILLPFYISFSKYLKSAFISLLAPPFKLCEGISSNARQFLSFQDLSRQNRDLQSRLERLKGELAQMEEISSENQRLRKILSLPQRRRFQTETASIIARDCSNWSKTMMLNKGSVQGLTVGMPVVWGAGLVGRIIEVTPHASKVSLIVDFNSRIPVKIFRSREQGIAYGSIERRRNICSIKYVQDVRAGDRIISSGLAGIYPKGFLIGRVISVEEEKNRLYKIAEIEPEVKFSMLEEAIVILNP